LLNLSKIFDTDNKKSTSNVGNSVEYRGNKAKTPNCKSKKDKTNPLCLKSKFYSARNLINLVFKHKILFSGLTKKSARKGRKTGWDF